MPKAKILVVDDEPDYTYLLRLNLELTGNYEVRTLNSPAQAFAVCKQWKPDLILLDLLMPVMNGGEVARQIKNDKEFTHIPIIFFTAVAGETPGGSAQRVAGYPYLIKPITLEKVLQCIEENLPKTSRRYPASGSTA